MERNISPRDPSGRLAEAKKDAQRLLLDDDATFAIIQEKLFDSNTNDSELPSFSVEPTLDRDETDQSLIGFRITKSIETTNNEIARSDRYYEHIHLGTLDRNSGIFSASDELNGLLASAGLEESRLSVAMAWQQSCQSIIQAMGQELALHPLTHTFELQSDLEQIAYSIDN